MDSRHFRLGDGGRYPNGQSRRCKVLPLTSQQLDAFRDAIRAAVKKSNSKCMTYKSEWIHLLPTHSIDVDGKIIDASYQYDFGRADLDQLVDLGCLRKLSESDEQPITLEKVVIFEIVD